ncbi:MAG: hypothetical protein JW915_22110 [Chitinispirillaceae bacterium]|nr:hypothetical protein [Chitinispirillaceae bacterium]
MRQFVLIFILTAALFSSSAQHAFSLDTVITRSDSCVAIEWTPDSSNTAELWYTQYGNKCTGSDTIYRHCDFIAGRTYRGIAYSYGGEDPWFTFRTRLATGFLAGSHQCHYNVFGDPSGKVTGTDCSGFLCFAWNIARTNTTNLYNNKNFTTVPITSVQAGDALVKASSAYGYHAILIVEAEDPAETVISEASSTVFGCRERIVNLTGPEWTPYKAIRNPALHTQQIANKSTSSSPALRVVQSGYNCITLHLSNPSPVQLTGYALNGSVLFKKQFDNARSHTFNSGLSSQVIYLSVQIHKTAETVRLSLH